MIIGLGIVTMLKGNLDKVCFKLKVWCIKREKRKKQKEFKEYFMSVYRRHLAAHRERMRQRYENDLEIASQL